MALNFRVRCHRHTLFAQNTCVSGSGPGGSRQQSGHHQRDKILQLAPWLAVRTTGREDLLSMARTCESHARKVPVPITPIMVLR